RRASVADHLPPVGEGPNVEGGPGGRRDGPGGGRRGDLPGEGSNLRRVRPALLARRDGGGAVADPGGDALHVQERPVLRRLRGRRGTSAPCVEPTGPRVRAGGTGSRMGPGGGRSRRRGVG